NEIAYAHRTDERARGEERMRVTVSSLAKASEGAALLAGALDIVEATLKLLRLKPDADEGGTYAGTNSRSVRLQPDAQEQIDGLARRAGDMRTDLRFLMRADQAEYVYFV